MYPRVASTSLGTKAEARSSPKFKKRSDGINGQLKRAGEGALSPEEFIAARLYTGPMGDKCADPRALN